MEALILWARVATVAGNKLTSKAESVNFKRNIITSLPWACDRERESNSVKLTTLLAHFCHRTFMQTISESVKN